MKHTNGDGSSLYDLARLGAPMRLKAIEAELQSLFNMFPELFPGGLPVLGKLERKPVETTTAAQRLIEGAEALHARARGRRPIGRPPKAKRPRSPNVPVTPDYERLKALQPEDRLTASQASQIFGCSTSNIYLQVKAGKLSVVDTGGVGSDGRFINVGRFRVADLKEALAGVLAKRGISLQGPHEHEHVPGPEQSTEHVQEQSV